MSKTLHLGIVGCGSITQGIHLPIVANLAGVKLDFLADLEPPHRVARDFGAAALVSRDVTSLPDCDIVLLATPLGAREPYIEEFGKRGTVVFTEKPFARDTAQHRRFLERAALVSCNYMRTVYSSVRQMQEIVRSNLFGALQRVVLMEGGIAGATGKTRTHYQTDKALSGGGILIEKGSHGLSLLVHILSGYSWRVNSAEIQEQHDLDVDVRARLSAQMESTVDVEFDLSLIRPLRTEARFSFEHAEVSFDPIDPSSRLEVFQEAGHATLVFEADERWARSVPQAFYLKWKKVVELAKDRTSLDSRVETSLTTTRLVEEIYRKGGSRASCGSGL